MFRNRETDIQSLVVKRAKARGWIAHRLDPSNEVGEPDYQFIRWDGEYIEAFYIEFKKPGEQPMPHQERRHKKLRAQGLAVYVIDNLEDGYALFSTLFD